MRELPLVSLIMPVFNAEQYLADAILSILEQSYPNFEFLIIDDGSKDNSSKIIEHFQKSDTRICVVRQPINQGLVPSLNRGLDIAQGKYIARMDADDISLPDRLSKQVEYLESHPDVGILGCGVQHIDQTGKLLVSPQLFLGDLSIRWHILFENPFYHPSIMLRNSTLKTTGFQYNPHKQHAEDFDLLSRLLLFTKADNLPDTLLLYRIHSESISEKNTVKQRLKATEISQETIQRFFPEMSLSTNQIKQLSEAVLGGTSKAKHQRSRLISIYLKIWAGFSQKHKSEVELSKLEHDVIAWAARMILYPPFQPKSAKALWNLTKINWKWLFYLIEKLPYYWIRHQFR